MLSAALASLEDSKERTALHWAAANGHKAVVRLLFEKSADVDAKSSMGQTALQSASSTLYVISVKSAKRLLLSRASVARSFGASSTPLRYLIAVVVASISWTMLAVKSTTVMRFIMTESRLIQRLLVDD
jgi:ankyrin repeat protein